MGARFGFQAPLGMESTRPRGWLVGLAGSVFRVVKGKGDHWFGGPSKGPYKGSVRMDQALCVASRDA